MTKAERDECLRLIRRITETQHAEVTAGDYYDRMIEARRLLKRLVRS